MADRMRANPVAVANGSYDGIGPGTTAPNCNPCVPAQLAQQDGVTWNQDLARLLPAGQGTIVTASPNVFDITVRWDAYRTGAIGTSCSHDPSADLTCLAVRVEL